MPIPDSGIQTAPAGRGVPRIPRTRGATVTDIHLRSVGRAVRSAAALGLLALAGCYQEEDQAETASRLSAIG